jgi:hypothetical protein
MRTFDTLKRKSDMKQTTLLLIFVALLNYACSGKQEQNTEADKLTADMISLTLEGDSTFYGLVCDGYNDTILVFLPINNVGADPDTFNILNASRQRQVFGRLKIGDNVAVVRNANDSTIAEIVIDLEDLNNTWYYQVMPTLHHRADMEGRTEKQMIASLPDSIQELLNVPHEYTMQIKGDHTARCFEDQQYQRSEEEASIIDYPKAKHYGQWNLFNGKLLLTEMQMDSLGNRHPVSTDTAELLLLSRDTLVLRFNDGPRSYYSRKKLEEN